jgi:hypothetical protein
MKGKSIEGLSDRLQALLEGRAVASVRLEERELLMEFADGRRLFVNSQNDGTLDISVHDMKLGNEHDGW